jgi:hypothetical protein
MMCADERWKKRRTSCVSLDAKPKNKKNLREALSVQPETSRASEQDLLIEVRRSDRLIIFPLEEVAKLLHSS